MTYAELPPRSRLPLVRPSRGPWRGALLCGVSVTALAAAGVAAPEARAAGPFRSINQALAQRGTGLAPIGANAASAQSAASAATALGMKNLAAAATRIAQFRSIASALAVTHGPSPVVGDGVGPNLLAQAAGVVPGSNGGSLWIGASTTLATGADPQKSGVTDVTVMQTSKLASLTWSSFNIGAHTKLVFDQSAGGAQASSWLVINKLEDAATQPSTILGSISAPGKVYVINRNGIAFGTGAQINVGSLIAATADIATAQFSTTAAGQLNFTLYGSGAGTLALPTFGAGSPTGSGSPTAAITVDAGASIVTPAPSQAASGGGYVMLFGGSVTNAGIIMTPQGQTVLAAGTDFILRPGYSPTGNALSTTLGNEVAVLNTLKGASPRGQVVNAGLIEADQGDITFVGHDLTQAGALVSTTTVNTRGTVHLLTDTGDSTADIVLAPGSVTEVVPFDDGQTALDSQRAANVSSSAANNALRANGVVGGLNDSNVLADQLGSSRIEISTGGSVTFQGGAQAGTATGALAITPGGQVAVGAGSGIIVQSYATIDVAGSTGAVLPASANDLLVNIQPYQLRDSAANRDGGLKSSNAYVDARTLVQIASGAYGPQVSNGTTLSSGEVYTPGGLLEVGGYLGLVPHGILDLTAQGGSVTLQADQKVPNRRTMLAADSGTVTTMAGSVINLAGGTLTYLGGAVNQSYVQTNTGLIYNINNAPGDLVYTGLYNGEIEAQPRWSISQTFVNPLLTPATRMDAGYTVGRDSGTLTVSAPTVQLDGATPASASPGADQNQKRPANVPDPFLLAQGAVPLAGTLQVGNYAAGSLQGTAYSQNFQFLDTGAAPPAAGIAAIDAPALNLDGFAVVSLATNGDIAVNAPIAVADGGTVSLFGGSIEANASITARAGLITLSDVLSVDGVTTILPAAGSEHGKPPSVVLTIASGVTLDARGVWTNAALDQANIAGEGFTNGGKISLQGIAGVDLQAGSLLDVSSGGAVLPGGKLLAANGGSIAIAADYNPLDGTLVGTGPVTIDAGFAGYGYSAGGTFSLTAPQILIGQPPVASAATLLKNQVAPVMLGQDFFALGFSQYTLNGFSGAAGEGIEVAAGAQVMVTRPVYLPGDPLSVPTGGDPASAYQVVLPALYRPTTADTIVQRLGASLTLDSAALLDFPAVGNSGGGALIDRGASVTVDPKQSIAIDAYGQVSVLGTLTAHGGTVKVANVRYEQGGDVSNETHSLMLNYVAGQSVWVGDGSLLDVSGQAVSFADPLGRRFGQAMSGGSIVLGGDGGASSASTITTDAQVILRPGARLDASGAAQLVDVVPGLETGSLQIEQTPLLLAGDGGTIVARSIGGIALDGSFAAAAGGAGAMGGSLVLRLDPLDLTVFTDIPAQLLQPAQILVSQATVPVIGALLVQGQAVEPGDTLPGDITRLGRVSQEQLASGGFGNLSLFAQNDISFDGSVALALSQSVTLDSAIIGSKPASSVGTKRVRSGVGAAAGVPAEIDSVTAPFINLIGYSTSGPNSYAGVVPNNPLGSTALLSNAALTLTTGPGPGLIDLQGDQFVGGSYVNTIPVSNGISDSYTILGPHGTLISTTATYTAEVAGFSALTLQTMGDIRLLGSGGSSPTGEFTTKGDLTLIAAQIYPVTGASGVITAGYDPLRPAAVKRPDTTNPFTSTLTIESDGVGVAPLSLGGTLTLNALVVLQDGVVRAPEGEVNLGVQGVTSLAAISSGVTFGAGSVTSVSLDGQTIPYGGTADGSTYSYGGTALNDAPFNPGILVTTQSFVADAGSTIDISGGGTISGAAFIPGRGGSVDVLKTPLLSTVGGTVTANATDQVFAILPGAQPAFAPVVAISSAGDAGYSAPAAAGEQITVGNEIPGLAAGTYTLLPAYYALLPGSNAYRVQITSGTIAPGLGAPGTAASLGNFTTAAPVFESFAGTPVSANVPVAALFTSAAGVRQLAQYDEETYSQFETAQAALFATPRPVLPQDAKTLSIAYPAMPGNAPALSIDPQALLLETPQLDASNVPIGYGSTIQIEGNADGSEGTSLAIITAADVPARRSIGIDAESLGRLQPARLVLGGTLLVTTTANELVFQGSADTLTVAPDVTLKAGEIDLVAAVGGKIDIQSTGISSATLTTIGAGAPGEDLASGFYFTNSTGNGTAAPVLSISNGQVVFVPNTDTGGGQILIGSGARLLAGGSLNFATASGASIGFGDSVGLAGKSISLTVPAVNIIASSGVAGFAGVLPAGLTITDGALQGLLAGDPVAGLPATAELTLTATQEVNIVGSASLDFGATQLVLNTPAIYGYGESSSASLTAQTFTWSGIAATQTASNGNFVIVSSLPGAPVASLDPNPMARGALALTISAQQIVLGAGPQIQASDQLQLDRLIGGYGTVTLAGSTDITANTKSSLSVYQAIPAFGQAGTGGDLVLQTPLLTTASGAVLKLTAGGALAAMPAPGAAPAATAAITTLGGEIDLAADSVTIETAVALPAGRLTATASQDITLGAGAAIDLSGRMTPIFDQIVQSPGGAFIAESTSGNFAEKAGALVDFSAPGAASGSVSISALDGIVTVDGAVDGSATGAQTAGGFLLIAGTLAASDATLSPFDGLNAILDAGGVYGSRAFEIATGDIAIDRTIRAHDVSVTADAGAIAVTGLIDASGSTPGSIALNAQTDLTLAATSKLDVSASGVRLDSYGQPIDAENRGHVTLASSAGSIALDSGASIDLRYDTASPGNTYALLGQLVLDAPRVGTNGVAVTAAGSLAIAGAATIDLNAFRTYGPATGDYAISSTQDASPGVLTLATIDADNAAYFAGVDANAPALETQLAGLIDAGHQAGTSFSLRPGVQVFAPGTLTILDDLDFSSLRSMLANGVIDAGRSVPGAVVFRAGGDLVVNGSVTDGFAPPPDEAAPLQADGTGWTLTTNVPDVPGDTLYPQDILLPASVFLSTPTLRLGTGTQFDTTRTISLNYGISIKSAPILPNVVIPFDAVLGADLRIPAGGIIATAGITLSRPLQDGTTGYAAGELVTGTIPAGSTIDAGSVFPASIRVVDGTPVPAGTLLSIFATSTIQLSQATDVLTAGALLPANTSPIFVALKNGVDRRLQTLDLRPVTTEPDGSLVQGYLYPLAALLPAGSPSWDLSFVAGANAASADTRAVLPKTQLDGGPTATAANTINQAPGSLLLGDQHNADVSGAKITTPAFSVIRTGTGDLSLVAGGSFDESSLFGIYTAGTQIPLADAAGNAAFDAQRNPFRQGDTPQSSRLLHGSSADITTLNTILPTTYQANYPGGGGDVLVSAQGDLAGDISPLSTDVGDPSSAVGNWLWRQGSGSFAGANGPVGQPSAWWINFGTFAELIDSDGSNPIPRVVGMVGFNGIGALGGGDVTVHAGGDAGQLIGNPGQGLVVAVGSTGRILPGSTTPILTGGGSISVQIGGTLNPLDDTTVAGSSNNGNNNPVAQGVVVNVRGDTTVSAGAVGRIDPTFGNNANDPRPLDPFVPSGGLPSDGIEVVGGDGTVDIAALRDVVLNGVGDPGRLPLQNRTLIDPALAATKTGGFTGFTLWTDASGIALSSAGGNVTPITAPAASSTDPWNEPATDYRYLYPPTLSVTAASGNIIYAAPPSATTTVAYNTLEVVPAPFGQVSFLAGGSIIAGGLSVDLSGADPAGLSTPSDPAFVDSNGVLSSKNSNIMLNSLINPAPTPLALFALEADTPTTDLHAADPQPARFYAAAGDIVDFQSGETIAFAGTANQQRRYIAAKPVEIIAGRDIVSSGTRLAGGIPDAQSLGIQPNYRAAAYGVAAGYSSGNLFYNIGGGGTSIVSAGRDILSGFFYVGGPGLLEVEAGRNLYQTGSDNLQFGAIKSIGSLLTGTQPSLTGGAGISVFAGIGSSGPAYTAFEDLYLNPSNQANLDLPITDPANAGDVQLVHTADLVGFLTASYGYVSDFTPIDWSQDKNAFPFFQANVPALQQDVFLRQVFFEELLASGRQYNDPTSRFFGSYARGREAIDTLFPSSGPEPIGGTPVGYSGSVTSINTAGISTLFGGTVQVLDPGGQVEFGAPGGESGAGSGIVTFGSGDVQVYSLGSLLLGSSRIFTTAGGNIQAWSSAGDINAGIGAKTTVVFNPPLLTYDTIGDITLTPTVPVNGAGIATLSPIPGIPAGDVDLTAPVGTIDAGEAGIRVSGNLNLAALTLANVANIVVNGKSAGIATSTGVSAAAQAAAGSAAGAATQAAAVTQRPAAQPVASIIEVDVTLAGETEDEKRRRHGAR